MRCPYCRKPLNIGPHREYETLSDHVERPNAHYLPLRLTYICRCAPEIFWDRDGYCYAFYAGKNSLSALDSVAYKFDEKERDFKCD